MTTTDPRETTASDLSAKADRHLWGHFARHGAGITPPIITRGEGVHIFDDKGKKYIDGLSGLFVVQVGHGRAELAEAAAKQTNEARVLPAVVLRARRARSNSPSASPSTPQAT